MPPAFRQRAKLVTLALLSFVIGAVIRDRKDAASLRVLPADKTTTVAAVDKEE